MGLQLQKLGCGNTVAIQHQCDRPRVFCNQRRMSPQLYARGPSITRSCTVLDPHVLFRPAKRGVCPKFTSRQGRRRGHANLRIIKNGSFLVGRQGKVCQDALPLQSVSQSVSTICAYCSEYSCRIGHRGRCSPIGNCPSSTL